MTDLDTVELSDMLRHFPQRSTLEVQIKGKRGNLRIIAAFEKAFVCNEPFAASSTLEAWSLALHCHSVAPTDKINAIAETAVIECENGLWQFKDICSLGFFFCSKPQA
jgi:hypothetical protein